MNIGTILMMMSAKIATQGLLKIKIFWNKGYDVIISVHYVTNKILSLISYYIVDVDMWSKFGNSSTSIRDVIITLTLSGFDQKNHFFEGWSYFSFNNLGLALGIALRCYTTVEKGFKVKVKKFWWLSLTFVKVKREKLVGGAFLTPSPILNRALFFISLFKVSKIHGSNEIDVQC